MKTIYTKLALIASLLFAGNAMSQISNGDFTAYANSAFTGWTGSATVANLTPGNQAAEIKSYFTPQYSTRYCLQFDKSGRCLAYNTPTIIGYIPTQGQIEQTMALTEMPSTLTGKYSFTSTPSGSFSSAIVVEGNYGGNMFKDTIEFSSNTTNQPFTLTIKQRNIIPCSSEQICYMGKNNTLICNTVTSCPNQNIVKIAAMGCLNCPTNGATLQSTSLIIDDLFFPVSTSIEDEIITNNPVYPNPTNGIIKFKGQAVITDLLGNILAEGTDVINIEELNTGLYMLKTAKGVVKIIKQ
jgi:hypothetical protein